MTEVPHEVQQAEKALAQVQQQSKMDLEKIKGQTEDAPTRAAAAVALRVDGASWSDIARILDYSSPQRARNAVERALGEETATKEEVEHIRWLNARRLEKILSSVMRRATNPKDVDHLQYARMAVVLIDRHIKLYGADAPQQMNVTYSPSTQQLEEWVAQASRQTRGQIDDEADIIDAEVVE